MSNEKISVEFMREHRRQGLAVPGHVLDEVFDELEELREAAAERKGQADAFAEIINLMRIEGLPNEPVGLNNLELVLRQIKALYVSRRAHLQNIAQRREAHMRARFGRCSGPFGGSSKARISLFDRVWARMNKDSPDEFPLPPNGHGTGTIEFYLAAREKIMKELERLYEYDNRELGYDVRVDPACNDKAIADAVRELVKHTRGSQAESRKRSYEELRQWLQEQLMVSPGDHRTNFGLIGHFVRTSILHGHGAGRIMMKLAAYVENVQ